MARWQHLRVGVAQIETALADIDTNKRRHDDMIERARAADLDVLVFRRLVADRLHGGSARGGSPNLLARADSIAIHAVQASMTETWSSSVGLKTLRPGVAG